MKDTYDDYIKPPQYQYKDIQGSEEDPLIKKLKLRIQQDLNQINGVYDSQISEAEEIKKKRFLKIESEYNDVISSINKQRKNDISIYNEKAEKHIDNLISNMNNIPLKIMTWWERICRINN